jgi:peptidoglycan/LPS O-acetylase OafA/YrhL
MKSADPRDGPAATDRIPALDGIRGLAIIWVILHNAMDQPAALPSIAMKVVAALVHPGWIGVQAFFALSGFLITSGLLATQRSANYFRDFYVKRALRILPLYYSVLLALFVLAPHLGWLDWPHGYRGHASLWLFTVNWTHDAPYGFAHFWSLAVEEQFYLLWPLVVWRMHRRSLFWCCLGISIAALVLRCALLASEADPWTLYTNTACRMDALALGAAAACISRDAAWSAWLRPRASQMLLLAALLILGGIPLTHVYDRYRTAGETIGYTLLAVCSALLVLSVALQNREVRRPVAIAILSAGPLRSFGKYSYAMYVFHGIINKLIGEPWLGRHFGSQPATGVVFLYALALLGVSYAIGYCSYHLLEKHFLKLKNRLAPQLRDSIGAS